MQATRPDPDLICAVKTVVEGDAATLNEVQDLVGEGREVNGRQDKIVYDTQHEDGQTLLEIAVICNNLAVAELLLEAGARFDIITKTSSHGGKHVFRVTTKSSAVSHCSSMEMAALLGRYNPPFEHFDDDVFPFATGAALIHEQSLASVDFNQVSAPRFGKANPEICGNPFYLDQIRTGYSGYRARRDFVNNSSKDKSEEPVWSFRRFGRSITQLSDRRLVLIAGKHEDAYDPDFKIYNDVTVLDRKGGVQHFIYPKDIFPPTDFHSATLIGEYILIIGNLGYQSLCQEGETQVLRLNLNDFSVERVATQGDNPDWISRHDAISIGDDILISGGKINPGNAELKGTYALNLLTMTWQLRNDC